MKYGIFGPGGPSGRVISPKPNARSTERHQLAGTSLCLGLMAGLLASGTFTSAGVLHAGTDTNLNEPALATEGSEINSDHPPAIGISKEIACYLGTNPQGQEFCGSFGKMAFAVQGDTQNPAFCFRVTVTNCGQITLTNIVVLDDRFGDLTTNLFAGPAGSLAPGTGASLAFKTELNVVTVPGAGALVTNRVTVSASSALTGRTLTAEDAAVADIVSAALSAEQAYSVDGGAVTNCLRLDANPHLVVIHAIISNKGSADALDVSVRSHAQNLPAVSAGPFSVPAGTAFRVAVCTNFAYSCTNQLSALTVSASLYARDGRLQSCATDVLGEPILTQSEARACFQRAIPAASGITAGSRQDGAPMEPGDARSGTLGRSAESVTTPADLVKTTPNK